MEKNFKVYLWLLLFCLVGCSSSSKLVLKFDEEITSLSLTTQIYKDSIIVGGIKNVSFFKNNMMCEAIIMQNLKTNNIGLCLEKDDLFINSRLIVSLSPKDNYSDTIFVRYCSY